MTEALAERNLLFVSIIVSFGFVQLDYLDDLSSGLSCQPIQLAATGINVKTQPTIRVPLGGKGVGKRNSTRSAAPPMSSEITHFSV
jgi:hypothetical protein